MVHLLLLLTAEFSYVWNPDLELVVHGEGKEVGVEVSGR